MAEIFSPEAAEMARTIGVDKIRAVDPMDLKSGHLRDLLSYWQQVRSGMPLPCASTINPAAIPKHLSQVFFLQVEVDPLRFLFRVVGDDIRTAHGRNISGQYVDEIEAFDMPLGQMIHEMYRWVLSQRKPVAIRGPNPALADGYTGQETVYLPFSNGGAEIVRILGAAVYYRDE